METKHEQFKNLIQGPITDLQKALDSDVTLIQTKDEKGMTLLHHAAFACGDNRIAENVFPIVVEKAVTLGIDLAKTDFEGQSIVHIVSAIKGTPDIEYLNGVNTILKLAPQTDLNVLSSTGTSALAYALQNYCFVSADKLIQAGVDVHLSKGDENKPLAIIDSSLKKLNAISFNPQEDTENPSYQHIAFCKKAFEQLRKSILSNMPIQTNEKDAFFQPASTPRYNESESTYDVENALGALIFCYVM